MIANPVSRLENRLSRIPSEFQIPPSRQTNLQIPPSRQKKSLIPHLARFSNPAITPKKIAYPAITPKKSLIPPSRQPPRGPLYMGEGKSFETWVKATSICRAVAMGFCQF